MNFKFINKKNKLIMIRINVGSPTFVRKSLSQERELESVKATGFLGSVPVLFSPCD